MTYTLLQGRLYPGIAHDHPAIHNYTQYVHWTVYGGLTRGVLQLSCLLLGLGGIQRDKKEHTIGLTLALPVSRMRLLLTRAMVGFTQVWLLALLPPFLITAASHFVHQRISIAYGLPFVPLWAIGGLVTFALSFLFSTLFASEYVSLAVAYMVYIFYLAGVRLPRFGHYHLHIADFMSGLYPGQLDRGTMLWGNTYPLAPVLGFSVAGIALIALSTLITGKQDL